MTDLSSYKLKVASTSGDGNCFYTAVFQCLNECTPSKEEILNFKKKISESITPANFLHYLNNEIKIYLSGHFEKEKELDELIQKDLIQALHNPVIHKALEPIYFMIKEHILKDGSWANEWAQQYTGKIHNVNIIVVVDTCNKFTPLYELNEEWSSIILINRFNTHWESCCLQKIDEDKIWWKTSYESIKKLLNL